MVQRNKNVRITEVFERKEKKNRLTLIAKFRLGSEMKEGRYWEGEEKKV